MELWELQEEDRVCFKNKKKNNSILIYNILKIVFLSF